jgi:AcrR family transcriptional regulator
MVTSRRTGTPARTVRERVRAEMAEEIKSVARRHLAEHGAASLSLRAVAREVGLVSSAVYRYYPSRDDLLTALIVDAYDAVGAAAEATEPTSGPGPGSGTTRRRSVTDRWLALATALRAWAHEHRHEYALIYGSPVPGYQAPPDTVGPAARLPLAFLRLVADGVASGEIDVTATGRIPRPVRSDLAALRSGAGLDIPDVVLLRAFAAWSQLLGSLTLELFGHLHNVIDDHDAYFETQMHLAGQRLRSGP